MTGKQTGFLVSGSGLGRRKDRVVLSACLRCVYFVLLYEGASKELSVLQVLWLSSGRSRSPTRGEEALTAPTSRRGRGRVIAGAGRVSLMRTRKALKRGFYQLVVRRPGERGTGPPRGRGRAGDGPSEGTRAGGGPGSRSGKSGLEEERASLRGRGRAEERRGPS